MAAIEVGILRILKYYQGDMLDFSFEIAGIDLTGMTLKCQIREKVDSEPILTFEEDDDSVLSSLTKTVVSSTSTTVRFYKTAQQMADIAPLSEYGARPTLKYILTIVMFTDDSNIEDTQTIVEGEFEVLHQITEV